MTESTRMGLTGWLGRQTNFAFLRIMIVLESPRRRNKPTLVVEKQPAMDAVSTTGSSTYSDLTEDKTAAALLDPQQMETLVESIAQQVASKLLLADGAESASSDEIVKQTVAKLMQQAQPTEASKAPLTPPPAAKPVATVPSISIPASPLATDDQQQQDKNSEHKEDDNDDIEDVRRSFQSQQSCDSVGMSVGSLYNEEVLNDTNFWNADFLQATAQLDNLSPLKKTARPFSLKQCRQLSAYMDAKEQEEEEEEEVGLQEIEEGDDDDDDDASEISDVSGLTGVFTAPDAAASPRRSSIKHNNKSSSLPLAQRSPTVVTFTHVTVREYEQILGDNPSCSTGGPTLAIGWRYQEFDAIDVHMYESSRIGRLRWDKLLLDRQTRTRLVQKLGYSETQIAAAVRSVNKVKHHRKQTINNLHAQGMEEAVESVGRRVKELFQRKGKNKKNGVKLQDGQTYDSSNAFSSSRHLVTSSKLSSQGSSLRKTTKKSSLASTSRHSYQSSQAEEYPSKTPTEIEFCPSPPRRNVEPHRIVL